MSARAYIVPVRRSIQPPTNNALIFSVTYDSVSTNNEFYDLSTLRGIKTALTKYLMSKMKAMKQQRIVICPAESVSGYLAGFNLYLELLDPVFADPESLEVESKNTKAKDIRNYIKQNIPHKTLDVKLTSCTLFEKDPIVVKTVRVKRTELLSNEEEEETSDAALSAEEKIEKSYHLKRSYIKKQSLSDPEIRNEMRSELKPNKRIFHPLTIKQDKTEKDFRAQSKNLKKEMIDLHSVIEEKELRAQIRNLKKEMIDLHSVIEEKDMKFDQIIMEKDMKIDQIIMVKDNTIKGLQETISRLQQNEAKLNKLIIDYKKQLVDLEIDE